MASMCFNHGCVNIVGNSGTCGKRSQQMLRLKACTVRQSVRSIQSQSDSVIVQHSV